MLRWDCIVVYPNILNLTFFFLPLEFNFKWFSNPVKMLAYFFFLWHLKICSSSVVKCLLARRLLQIRKTKFNCVIWWIAQCVSMLLQIWPGSLNKWLYFKRRCCSLHFHWVLKVVSCTAEELNKHRFAWLFYTFVANSFQCSNSFIMCLIFI